MPKTGRPKVALLLSEEEKDQLLCWSRRPKSSQALALRSRIVLACAEGLDNSQVATSLGCHTQTVGKWRARFVTDRLEGLCDEYRSGCPRTISDKEIEALVVTTLEEMPKNATHWTRSKMASRIGLSESTVGRVWKAFNLKPHRTDGFKFSNDPLFIEKTKDVVGLYLNPPENAVVYCVDEKSQIQALGRSQPALPMMNGMPEKRTHDYLRYGTTTLFAGMNIADGTIIGKTFRSHRAIEFRKFLQIMDNEIPEELAVHVVCDNYQTHKTATIQRWLEAHPRFTFHFTPTYSSWLNQVERLFAYVTADLLQRSDHRSVQSLEADLRAWVKGWNENPKPFIWTKTADQILASLGRLILRTSGGGH